MFNLSASLLDDALKPERGVINENHSIFDEVTCKAYRKYAKFWTTLM